MKRGFKFLLVILLMGVVIGCAKNVSKVSYTKFYEYFSNKQDFSIRDDTSSYDINIRKYLEVVASNYQIYYVEYDSEKNANTYIDSLKKEGNGYKVTKNDKYTYVENTSGNYFVAYKIDSTIVIGKANDIKYKGDVNSVLRDLGY